VTTTEAHFPHLGIGSSAESFVTMAANLVCIIANLFQNQLGYYSSPAPVSGHAGGEAEERSALVMSRLQLRMWKCVTTSWKYTSMSGDSLV
jgi:hypothetical protein